MSCDGCRRSKSLTMRLTGLDSVLLLLLSISAVLSVEDGADGGKVKLQSGLLVRGEEDWLEFTLAADVHRSVNFSIAELLYIEDSCSDRLINFADSEVFTGNSLNRTIHEGCFYVSVCYQQAANSDGSETDSSSNSKKLCTTEERIVVQSVYRPSVPTQLGSTVTTTHKVEVKCTVNNYEWTQHIQMDQLLCEAEIICLEHCRTPWKSVERFVFNAVSKSCNIEFDQLDSGAMYSMTVRAMFPDSPFKSAPLNLAPFRTDLFPPSTNPEPLGFERKGSQLRLIVTSLPPREAISATVLNFSVCTPPSEVSAYHFNSFFAMETVISDAVNRSRCVPGNFSVYTMSGQPSVLKLNNFPRTTEQYQVEMHVVNKAGQSTAPSSRMTVSEASNSEMLRLEFDHLDVFIDHWNISVILCWSLVVQVDNRRSVPLGNSSECLRELGRNQTFAVNRKKVKDEDIHFLEALDQAMTIQFDWLVCESESRGPFCDHLLSNESQRMPLGKALQGAVRLSLRSINSNGYESLQFGIGATVFDLLGHELLRSAIQYERCTYSVHLNTGPPNTSHVHAEITTSYNNLTLQLPINSCQSGNDWFLKHYVIVHCHRWWIKSVKQFAVWEIPGAPAISDLYPCGYHSCKNFTWDRLPNGMECVARVKSCNLDGFCELGPVFTFRTAGLHTAFALALLIVIGIPLLALPIFIICFLRRKRRKQVKLVQLNAAKQLHASSYSYHAANQPSVELATFEPVLQH